MRSLANGALDAWAGGKESSEFLRQSRAIAEAFLAADAILLLLENVAGTGGSAVGDDQRHDDEGHAIPHFVAHGVHCLAASARKF